MPCCAPTTAVRATTEVSVMTEAKVHLHIHAADFSAAVAFYRTFFGLDPIKLKPGYAKFLPSWAPVNLAISEHAASRGGAISHVGVQLTSPEAVHVHLQRLQSAGLSVRVEMGVDCCHANQDKFWVTAPDDIEWEIYYLNYDIDETPAVAGHATSACCR